MLRPFELPLVSELPAFDEEPALFDPSPEWFVPGLKPSPREDEGDDDGLGLRALIEHPAALAKAWRRERLRNPTRRAKRRRRGRSHAWRDGN